MAGPVNPLPRTRHNRLMNKSAGAQREPFRNEALLPIVSIFLALSFIAVLMRLWTRVRFVKILGWDDCMIVASLAFFIVYCITVMSMFSLAGHSRGLQDLAELHVDKIRQVTQLLIVTEVFYILTMIALKLSLATFFLRILVTRWQRWIIIAVVSLSTVCGVFYLFFAIFQCGWFVRIDTFILRIVEGRCAPKSLGLGMNYTYAVLSTISDWTCGLIPIFIIADSKMESRKKLMVGGLMLFAALGSVASVARMIYLAAITVPTGDFFVKISKLSIWSTIEPGTGITVASIATLRPLFQKALDKTSRISIRSRTSKLESSNLQDHEMNTSGVVSDARKKVGSSWQFSTDSTMVSSSSHGSQRQIRKSISSMALKAAPRISKEENVTDIEAEMRAYGMSDFNKCATLEEEDCETERTSSKKDWESARRERWFQSQRAMRISKPDQTFQESTIKPDSIEESDSQLNGVEAYDAITEKYEKHYTW